MAREAQAQAEYAASLPALTGDPYPREAREAREATSYRRSRAATRSCYYDRVRVDYGHGRQSRTPNQQGIAALRDIVSRERLDPSERLLLALRERVLSRGNETERLLRRAEDRDERSLLAQAGVSQAHRVMVTDDTWNRRYRIVDGHAISLGSTATVRGYSHPESDEPNTVLIRHRDSDGAGIVPHSLFEPESDRPVSTTRVTDPSPIEILVPDVLRFAAFAGAQEGID